jgi:hypothetical protein
VNGSALLDTNGLTARLHEKSPLASLYAKHLFGQRALITPRRSPPIRWSVPLVAHDAVFAGCPG